jgi:hypothetical protein
MGQIRQGYFEGDFRYFLVDESLGTLLLGEAIENWAEIPINVTVVLTSPFLPPKVGRTDGAMEDGAAIWLISDWTRRLILRDDGYDVHLVAARGGGMAPAVAQ